MSNTSGQLLRPAVHAFGPGFDYNIGLEYEERKRLSTPYSQEVCDVESDYDDTECHLQCLRDIHFSNCTCAQGSPSAFLDCRIFEIILCVQLGAEDEFNSECLKRCLPPCHTSHYNAHISSTLFPTRNTFGRLKTHINIPYDNVTEARNNMLVLNFYADSMQYKKSTQKQANSLTSLFADIGGLLGLCLGASIMTLLEIVEMLFACCVKAVQKMFRVRSTSVTNLDEKPQDD